MRAIPAVDLREGACVQLVGGAYEAERVRLPDPLAVARRWREAGFRTLHVVDLDAATGRGDNSQVVQQLAGSAGLDVQVGGGVRSRERIEVLVRQGAARVVVGTRAVEEPAWLEEMAGAFPGRLVVAADVRGRNVVTRGWAQTLERNILDAVNAMRSLPLAGLLVTAVHKEGQMQGTDLSLMKEVASASPWPVQASGGVSTLADLRELQQAGVAGAVVGMALYTGALDPQDLAREFP